MQGKNGIAGIGRDALAPICAPARATASTLTEPRANRPARRRVPPATPHPAGTDATASTARAEPTPMLPPTPSGSPAASGQRHRPAKPPMAGFGAVTNLRDCREHPASAA